MVPSESSDTETPESAEADPPTEPVMPSHGGAKKKPSETKSPSGEPSPEEKEETCWSCIRQHIILACLVVTVLIACTGLVGWMFKQPSLFQIHPDFAPMQVTTSISFLLAGVSAILLLFKFRKLASLLILGTVFLSWVTLIEHLTGQSFAFLDGLFSNRLENNRVEVAGRMSFFSSVLLSFATVAVLSLSLLPTRRTGQFIAAIFSSWVIAISALAMIGYISGVTATQGWSDLAQMSLPSVTCFLAMGIALSLTALRDHEDHSGRPLQWLPMLILNASLVTTIVLSNSLRNQEAYGLRQVGGLHAVVIQEALESELRDRHNSIRRMARRWKGSSEEDRQRWLPDAYEYLQDDVGYRGIAWVDADFIIRWYASRRESADVTGLETFLDPTIRENLIRRLALNEEVTTARVGGKHGDIAIVSTTRGANNEVTGYIVATLSQRSFFFSVFPEEMAKGYLFQITLNGGIVYRRDMEQLSTAHTQVLNRDFEINGSRWNLEIWPSESLRSSEHSFYAPVMTGLGVVVSFLLGLSAYLYQVASRKSKQAAERNVLLQQEISARIRSQKELEKASGLNQAIVSHSAYAVITTDTEGTITSFNPSAERMLGYDSEEVIGKLSPAVFHDRDEVAARATQLSKRYKEAIEPGFLTFIYEARQGIDRQMEWTYIRKDGSRVPVSLAVTAITGDDGEISGYLGVAADISELKNTMTELKLTHDKLMEASMQAGRAEVATNILHNVGNVLNSINVSASLISDQLRNSRTANVARVAQMLKEHREDLPTFFAQDRRGRELPDYLDKLCERLSAEQKQVLDDLAELDNHIQHIKEIVVMQQNYAKVGEIREVTLIHELIAMAIRMQGPSLSRHHVNIQVDCDPTLAALIEKHKTVQILINLLSNAKHACLATNHPEHEIQIRVDDRDAEIAILVEDNGEGIPAENMTKIFTHGFTTKKDGHGFGLHSCALAAKEMKGSLQAASDGPGKGATFTLILPKASE